MLAAELACKAECTVTIGNCEIKGVADNSKNVKKGFVFAVMGGTKTDGESYIAEAIKNSAVAILLPRERHCKNKEICCFYAENIRRSFALMVTAFYPKQPQTIVAVTGTNGKTSTSVFARQIWEKQGLSAASMGTIGIISNVFNEESAFTSPIPSLLYPCVQTLAEKGITNLAIEASSHGIEQSRLDGLKIKAAGFTNLTRDHLDYHKTMEGYLLAKLRLFSDVLDKDGTGVINADVPETSVFVAACKNRKCESITYGFKGKGLKILNRRCDEKGQNLLVDVMGKKYNFRLPLAGDFQAMNALCALGLTLACGADADKAIEALESIKGACGRLENVVTLSNGAAVYVDYAHTPDAMENVLNTLRPNTVGKLSIVFGCGGDRDRGKRPQMGEVAARLADKVFVTDDNPRTESAAFIRSEIMPACPAAIEVDDRRVAIYEAIKDLKPNDVLVIAGKGHENGQKIGDKVFHFNDTEEALKAAFKIDPDAHKGSGKNTAVLWNTQELAEEIGACTSLDEDIYGFTADENEVKPADMFIALKQKDVAKALDKGAKGAIVQDASAAHADLGKLIIVGSGQNALDDITAATRERLKNAKAIALFHHKAKENISAQFHDILAAKGKSHLIKANFGDANTVKMGIINATANTAFLVFVLDVKDYDEVSETFMVIRPDILLIGKDDATAKIADAFKQANVGAALILDAEHKNACEIIKAAKSNGINKIVCFGENRKRADELGECPVFPSSAAALQHVLR